MKQYLRRLSGNTDKWYSLSDNALSSVFRIVSSMAVLKLAGEEIFAEYVILFTTYVIIQSLSNSYFIMPLAHSAGLGKSHISEMYRWTEKRLRKLQVFIALLIGVSFFVTSPLNIDHHVFTGFGGSILFSLSAQNRRSRNQTHFKSKIILISNIYGLALHSFIFLVGWHYYNAPLAGYWWGCFASQICCYYILNFLQSSETKGERVALSHEIISRVTKDGLHMTMGSLANMFSSRSQPFVLSLLSGSLAVSYFGVVMTFSGPLRILSVALQNTLRPRFALFVNDKDPDRFRKLYFKSQSMIIALGIVALLVSFCIESTLVTFLLGTNNSFPAGLLSLAIFLATLDAVTSCQMVAIQTACQKGPSKTTQMRWIAAGVNLLIIFPLSYYYGATGAIISALVSECFYFCLAQSVINKNDLIPKS